MLERVALMKLPLSLKVGGVRVFGRSESAQVDPVSLENDSRREFSATRANAKDARRASLDGSASVLVVDFLRYVSQVRPAVITSYAVQVINVVRRPFARDVKPDHAVNKALLGINGHLQVAVAAGCSRDVASVCSVGRPDASSKNTGLGVVVEKLSDACRGQTRINLAHAVVLLKRWFGKWSPTVSAAGLCAFYSAETQK